MSRERYQTLPVPNLNTGSHASSIPLPVPCFAQTPLLPSTNVLIPPIPHPPAPRPPPPELAMDGDGRPSRHPAARPHEMRGDLSAEPPRDGADHEHGGGGGWHRKRRTPWIREREPRKSSGLVWALVILCTLLAIGVIIAGATVFAVYLLYKPKMPYLLVSDARLDRLDYSQSGTIEYLQLELTILAENSNSKVDATFSGVRLAVGFHGADVAFLRAGTFVVARRSNVPLRYQVLSSGRQLSTEGMQYMDGALRDGVVPLDLFGKARTTWKVGIFASLQFWTRINCRFLFNYPGNGTAMPIDCRSKSP